MFLARSLVGVDTIGIIMVVAECKTFIFVTITGVEPMAFGFGIQCSTN